MSTDKQEGTETIPTEVQLVKSLKTVITDIRILLGLGVAIVVGLFGGGWAAYAQVREVAKDEATITARVETAGLREEQAAVKASLAIVRDEGRDTREEVRETRTEVRGLRDDLRVIWPRLPATDAGK